MVKTEDALGGCQPDNAIRITISAINRMVAQLRHDLLIANLQQNLRADARRPDRTLITRRQRGCGKGMHRGDRQSTAMQNWLKGDRNDRALSESIESAARAKPYIAFAALQHAMYVVVCQTVLLGK